MSFLSFLGGLIKKPMAILMVSAGAIISLLLAALGSKNREIGRKEVEAGSAKKAVETIAEAERLDQEELKQHKKRSTDHENHIRNGGSPFVDD